MHGSHPQGGAEHAKEGDADQGLQIHITECRCGGVVVAEEDETQRMSEPGFLLLVLVLWFFIKKSPAPGRALKI